MTDAIDEITADKLPMAPAENTNEIFLNLCEGRAHFKRASNNLYFVDSIAFPVTEMIHQVFRGLHQVPAIRQCYLDQHSFFKGAYCIHLQDSQVHALLVALRLQGIRVRMN